MSSSGRLTPHVAGEAGEKGVLCTCFSWPDPVNEGLALWTPALNPRDYRVGVFVGTLAPVFVSRAIKNNEMLLLY